jgi:hypothetical protein
MTYATSMSLLISGSNYLPDLITQVHKGGFITLFDKSNAFGEEVLTDSINVRRQVELRA